MADDIDGNAVLKASEGSTEIRSELGSSSTENMKDISGLLSDQIKSQHGSMDEQEKVESGGSLPTLSGIVKKTDTSSSEIGKETDSDSQHELVIDLADSSEDEESVVKIVSEENRQIGISEDGKPVLSVVGLHNGKEKSDFDAAKDCEKSSLENDVNIVDQKDFSKVKDESFKDTLKEMKLVIKLPKPPNKSRSFQKVDHNVSESNEVSTKDSGDSKQGPAEVSSITDNEVDKSKQKIQDKTLSKTWDKMGVNRCTNCKFTTDSTSLFMNHTTTCIKPQGEIQIAISLKNNLYGCDSCRIKWSKRADFEEHVICHLISNPYSCINCKRSFASRKVIEIHARKDHPNGESKCMLSGTKKAKKVVDQLESLGYCKFNGRYIVPKCLTETQERSTANTKVSYENRSAIPPVKSGSLEKGSQLNSTFSYTVSASNSLLQNKVQTVVTTTSSGTLAVKSSGPFITVSQVPITQSTSASSNTTRVGQVRPFVRDFTEYKAPISTTASRIELPRATVSSQPVLLIPVQSYGSVPSNVLVPLPQGSILRPVTCGPNLSAPFTGTISNSSAPRILIPTSSASMPNMLLPLQNVGGTVMPVQGNVHVVSSASNLRMQTNPAQLIGTTSKPISYAQAIPVGAQVQLTSSASASLSVVTTQSSVQGSSSAVVIPHTVTQITENGTVSTTLPKVVSDFVANTAFEKTKANNMTTPTVKIQSITSEVCKNDTRGPKSCPRKFLFRIKPSHGYMCEACKKYTKEENTFKKHVWEHFHQEGMTLCKQCNFREGDKRKMQCPLVADVVKSLKQSCANQTGQPLDTKGQETLRDARELLITISDDEEDKFTADPATVMPLERRDAAELVQGKKGSDDGQAVIVIDQETSEEKEMHIQIESTYSLAKDNVEEFDNRLNDDGVAVGSDFSEDQSKMQNIEPTMQEFDGAIAIDDEQLKYKEEEIKASSKPNEDSQIMADVRTDLLITEIVTKIMTNESPEILSVLNDCEYVKASENMTSLVRGVGVNQDSEGDEIVDIETVTVCRNSVADKIESTFDITQKVPSRRSSKDDIIALSKEIFEKPKESVRQLSTSFYKCGFEQCSFTCLVSQKYREHLTIYHHGESNYRCDHCGHKNYSEDSHYRHMFNHASAKAFELYICPFKGCKCSTNLLQVFKHHLEKNHPKEQGFKCHYCHQAFSSVQAVIAHFRENLLQFISCSFCTFKFGRRSSVLKHVRHSHPDRPKQIVVTSQLICKERLQNNFKEKDFIASPVIGMNGSFATPDADLASETNQYEAQKDLTVNIRTEPNQLVKSKIDLSFIQSNLVSVASQGKQSETYRSLKCAHCTYLAWNTNFLALHQKVHQHEPNREMRFLCPCCPQATSNFGKLKKHISNHIGQHKVKVFTCVTCGFHTTQRYHIIDHLKDAHYERSTYTERVETIKSTEFSCRFCEYKSRRSDEIALHESAIHAHENFVSEDMGITALQESSKKSLKYHCQYCQLQFKHRSILREHLESNHSDIQFKNLVTFQCKLCDFASTQKNLVLKHSLRKHSGKAARIIRKVENIDEEVELDDASLISNSSNVPDGMTIYLFHCDFCPFSTNSSSDLERHVSSHHNRENCLLNSDVNEYSGPKEEVPIPDGNIYKVPFQCPKCPFNNRIRINVMRHIKRHPELVPVRESNIAPSREHDVRRPSVARKSTTARKSNLKADASSHRSNIPDSSQNNMSQDDAENPFIIVKANVAELDKKPSPLVTEESAAEKYRLGEESLDVKLSPCFIHKGPETGNKCRICKKIIAKKYVLHRHILEHLQINFFKCQYCEHGTLEQTMLCAHIHKDHPLKSLTFQSIAAKDADVLIEQKIHALELHESDSEEESENLPQNDEEDEKVFTPSLPSQTSETSQQFDHSGLIENQLASNIRREDLVCKICNYEATTSYFFKLHLDCHEEDKEKRFGCSYCGYKTNIKRDVSRHIEKRHAGRSIRIRTYGNVSVTKQKQPESSQVKEQLVTETKEQPSQDNQDFSSGAFLKCSQCDYRGTNSVVMSCHEESHRQKAEKKFGCSSCGYRANHSSNVRRHIRMCHPDKPMTVLLLSVSTRDIENKRVDKKELNDVVKIEQFAGNDASNKITEDDGKNEVKNDNMGSSPYQIRVTFKCKECGERRESKSGMYKHFTNSQCKKPWHKCDYCAFTSHAKSAIVQHTKLRHPGIRISMTQLPLSCKIRKIKCPVKHKTSGQVQEGKVDPSSEMKDVSKVGSTAEGMSHSVNQAEVETDLVSGLSCYLCHDFKTSSHVKMQFHLNTKHGGKTLFCMECPFKTSLFKHMFNHCKNDHQQSLVRYSLRAKTTHDAQVLPRKPRPSVESHGSAQSSHSSKVSESDDISSYKCCICEWEGKQIGKLRGHMCTHLNYKPFVCKYCGARVQYLNNVKRHIVTVHSGKDLKYTVQRDEATEAKLEKLLKKSKLLSKLPKLKALDWQKIAKKEDAYYLCKKCEYRTDRRKRIVEHYELKHGIRVLNVPDRRKSGTTQPMRSPAKRPLQTETKDIPPPTEMKMDTGAPFENSMSTASLKYKVGLDPETNQRLYECVKCSYKAAAKKNLLNHMTSHGVRNYQCMYCDYSAKLINNAYRHIKNVHKGMPLRVYNRKYCREMIPKKEEDANKMGDSTTFPREKEELQEEKEHDAAEESAVILQVKGMVAESSQKLAAQQGHRSPRGNRTTVLKYNCNICECTITGLYHFRQHLSQHSEFSYFTKGSEIESRLSCGYCSYMAIDDVDFSRHISSHLEERPFSCGYCDFSAYRASGIRQHLANAHSDEPEKVVNVMTSSAHMAELRPIKQIMLVDCDPKVALEKIDQLPWFRELTEGKLKVTDELLKYGYKKLQPKTGKKRLIKRSLKEYGFETMSSETKSEPSIQGVKKDQKSRTDTSEMKILQDAAGEDIKQNSLKSGQEKEVISSGTDKNTDGDTVQSVSLDKEENPVPSSDIGVSSMKKDEKEALLVKEITTLRPKATKRLLDSDVDDQASKKIKMSESVDRSSSAESKGKINSESEGEGSKYSDIAINKEKGINVHEKRKVEVVVFNYTSDGKTDITKNQAIEKNSLTEDNSKTGKDKEMMETLLDGKTAEAALANELCPSGDHSGKDTTTLTQDKVTKTPEKKKVTNIFDKMAEEMSNSPASSDYSTHDDV